MPVLMQSVVHEKPFYEDIERKLRDVLLELEVKYYYRGSLSLNVNMDQQMQENNDLTNTFHSIF